MSTSTRSLDLAQLRKMHERLREETAAAEHADYLHWQEAYGAYECARDEADAAWMAWLEAVVP